MIATVKLLNATLTTTGTRQRLMVFAGAQPKVTSIIVRALSTNTGATYIGDATVAVTGEVGIALAPGATLPLGGDNNSGGGTMLLNINDLWFDSATNGNKVCIAYIEAVG